MPRASRLALIAGVFAPLTAAAQPPPAPSPEGATALQGEIRTWLGTVLGPAAPPPAAPVSVAAEGDHYRLGIDIGVLPGWSGGREITAAARPLDGGRWTVDHIRFPQPAAFRVDLPATKDRPAGPLDLALTIASQDTHALIDPAFVTPSTLSSKLGAYDVVFAGPGLHGVEHLDGAATEASMVPTANGRVDATEEASGHGFSATQDIGSGGTAPLAITAGTIAMSAHLDGLDQARAMPALRRLMQLSAGTPATATAPMPDRGTLRALYLAWRGIVTGGALSESIDQVHIIAAGHEIGFDRISIGGAAATPDGTLGAHLRFVVDGLTSPELPPYLRDFVPRHVALQPSISAINLADLDALILAATTPGEQHVDPAPLLAAMFAHGGIVAGIDMLELDLGPAQLTGTGKLTAIRPDRLEGNAELSMTGFEALADRINAVPAFAAAVPFVTMARGLGRQRGDAMVWKITSENDDVKVNGTDMTALLGQAKQQEQAAPGTLSAPRRVPPARP